MDMIKKGQIRADAALQSPTHLRRSAVLWFGFLRFIYQRSFVGRIKAIAAKSLLLI
ncbi:hypothetical protein [Candidatus Aalborgicola defluviihabitans]|uniref:hypothetical protein n=1 Tax=Candidatus Aalborgicola defluviihabitans TaxID=3386187 RepID=UPI001EC137C3|nr:hypothetical protein [Burkholderiales bacterium]